MRDISRPTLHIAPWLLLVLLCLLSCSGDVAAMRSARIAELRQETVDMFYHGYDNYMNIAFPEDELRPLSCTPLTRDAENPRHVELNDVLGNYSLTLIDTLSTLAILASAPPEDGNVGSKALRDFQHGVAALVEQYGDGRAGPSGCGLRGRGFDVDSKVQVFETVIRGVGGLLSAHLFAIGELPISGYNPPKSADPLVVPPIAWPEGFTYDGQLLRLALDLATRLLPAFYTHTGMPYPRVNLRHGIPFYLNSPLHGPNLDGATGRDGDFEITETCSAGAGSLVLEFTVLSRLTGDPRFEQLAKRAFWAVWYRRSDIGLIGAGVDAEQGKWIGAYSVIGAGADSFFEYALKTHILLSGHSPPNLTLPHVSQQPSDWLDPNSIFPPLSRDENSPDSFLEAWQLAHAAIKRHLYSDRDHPHYVNVNLWTGSLASNWIDSLGAYYSGLLTLAGEIEEAIETNLLYTAVWTRYAALPERWSLREKAVEGGLGWWPLRPEFVESVYHIYRATRDPWYLYVGEMVLRDITVRCWTKCGWAGLQNVLDGEKTDRMESFFLGETAKYLYLLFDDGHPLNSLDAAYVFTTEGHPLIIPKKPGSRGESRRSTPATRDVRLYEEEDFRDVCSLPPKPEPLTGSAVAARGDIFHAAKVLDLHLVPNDRQLAVYGLRPGSASSSSSKVVATNHTIYPWTLPARMLPNNGTCAKVNEPMEMTLEFAANAQEAVPGSAFNFIFGSPHLERLSVDKIRVRSISGLKLIFRLEDGLEREWRVTKINGIPLGRDESVIIDRALIAHISDPRFNMVRDTVMVKLHHLHTVMVGATGNKQSSGARAGAGAAAGNTSADIEDLLQQQVIGLDDLVDGDDNDDDQDDNDQDTMQPAIRPSNIATMVKSLLRSIVSSLDRPQPPSPTGPDTPIDPASYNVIVNLTAMTPTGRGAALLPDVGAPPGTLFPVSGPVALELLPWTTVYAGGDACGDALPDTAARDHQVIVLRRGGCSFSEKLARIPAHSSTWRSVQLVVVVSDEVSFHHHTSPYSTLSELELNPAAFVRPVLDEQQASPAGLPRRNPLAMVMVGGGEEAYRSLAGAEQVGLTRVYHVESQSVRVRNIIVDDGEVSG